MNGYRSMAATLAAAVGLALAATAARADEVVFKNGDKLSGTITTLDAGKLAVSSKVAGDVKVDLGEVKTFSTDNPIELHLKDGTVIKQKFAAGDDGKVNVVAGGAIAPQAVAIADVTALNPPKKEVKWVGSIAAGAMITRGNTETDNINVGIDAQRRAEDDRLSLGAGYLYGREKNKDSGEKTTTTDNWFAAAKYDYFFEPKFYGYANVRVERDRIADLDLRLTPGVGVGYQWVERPDFNFNTEAGLTWVYEKYNSSDDSDDHFAARLAYHVDKKFNDKIVGFHNLEYLPSVEDLSDYNLRTDAGLRSDLTKSMFAEFKVELQYDSSPAPDAKNADVRYLVSIGWKF